MRARCNAHARERSKENAIEFYWEIRAIRIAASTQMSGRAAEIYIFYLTTETPSHRVFVLQNKNSLCLCVSVVRQKSFR